MPLTIDAMIHILTEPKNALMRQYQYLFHLEDAMLEFTDDALKLIAEKALTRKTGSRALRAVLDEFMIDMMYDLPDYDAAGVTFVLDEESLESKSPLATLPQSRAKESA